jgi:hypothetical protein
MRVMFLSASGQQGGAETSLLDILASLRQAEPSWPLHLVVAGAGPLAERAAGARGGGHAAAFSGGGSAAR